MGGGGMMQIAAYGAQDVYLTGNPQITYFKMVYRKHTNFAMEAVPLEFNGDASFGKTIVCTIPRNGDLLYKMYVKVKFSTKPRALCDLRRLLKSVELEIGGQRIDKQYYTWQAAWHYLTYSGNQKACLKQMTETVADTTSCYYLPLDFWFNRSPGLALPLIALQYHDVRIRVRLEDSTKIYDNAGCAQGTGFHNVTSDNNGSVALDTVELLCDYIYLDVEERRRFAQASHEYLIEQVQHTGTREVSVSTADTKKSYNLQFNHPVKELVWHLSLEDGMSNYAEQANVTGSSIYVSAAKLQLNGHNRTKEETGDYFMTVQPFQHHTGIGGWAGNTVVNTSVHTVGQNATTMLGMPPTGQGDSVSGANTTTETTLRGHYHTPARNVNQVGAPHGGFDTYGFGNIVARTTVGGQISQVQNHNSNGARAGRDGGYYCYSFGIRPEEHQPSGTCNFSRIDKAKLNITYGVGNSTTSKTRDLHIFAHGYNVFRIMSGMGGLAYNN